ncbi:MAG TPA: hypothetical protein VH274_01970 [Mycobacteriales bacterium]|nr:hypothetical protein [Mycobacteriales bacterium]
MTERTWEKYGAATGIAFGILLLVAVFMVPNPPHIDASANKIASFYGDHRHAVLWANVVGTLSAVAAVLFICHLRHVFDRVEGGVEGISTVVFGTGLVAVAFAALSGILQSAMALMSAQPGGGLGDAGLVRALYDIGYVGNGVAFMFVAAWLGAVAVGMVRGEVASPALGWFGGLVGVACVAAGVSWMTVGNYTTGWTIVSFVALIGLAAWDIVAGAVMMRRPAVEAMSSHHSLIGSTT